METDWKKITEEVLNSEYVRFFIRDVMKDIREGKKVFEDTDISMPYGFGEDFYYKTKKDLVRDAAYQAFEDSIEEECPTLLEWLYSEVQDRLKYEIMSPKHLKDYITISSYKAVVRIDIDYDELLEKACENVLDNVNKMTDEEIERYVQEITKC